jgi:hypothetical protein
VRVSCRVDATVAAISRATCTRFNWRTALTAAALAMCIAVPESGGAADLDLVNAGVRWRVGGKRVLGQVQPEAFREWDVWAGIRLPWEEYGASGWGAGTRLLASAGAMQGAESTALVLSVLPVIALGSRDGRWNFDLGAGVAVISQHRFSQQDFGGPLQFALTAGASVPLYRRVGVGYRFMHYSDAGGYGMHTIGADFHMIEFIYRF